MTDLQVLSPNSLCAACLGDRAERRFCSYRCERTPNGTFEYAERLGDGPRPHLHRTCERCRYEWLEDCLAITPTSPPAAPQVEKVVVLRFHGECPKDASHTPLLIRHLGSGGARLCCGQCAAEWLTIVHCEYPPGVEGDKGCQQESP